MKSPRDILLGMKRESTFDVIGNELTDRAAGRQQFGNSTAPAIVVVRTRIVAAGGLIAQWVTMGEGSQDPALVP
jgi:hypothetical protein